MTVEANPETVTAELARLLRASGVTRVSLGAQTFRPALLDVLERRAGPEDVRRAFYHLRDAGFDNISLDLLYGIPGQSACRPRARPRGGARARAGARLLLRARGEAGNAVHARARGGARAPGGGDGGLLRAGRRGARRRRLPLVRDGELLPARAGGAAQPRLLARPRLPRPRDRRGLDRRRAAAGGTRRASRATSRRSRAASGRRARSRSSTRSTQLPGAADARPAARPAAAVRGGRAGAVEPRRARAARARSAWPSAAATGSR